MTAPDGMYAAIPTDVVARLEALGNTPERYVLIETPAYKEWRRTAALLICRSLKHPSPQTELPCSQCLAHVDQVAAAPLPTPPGP